ncbi:LysR substrate-binding domain-containing protein [Cupriavidus sp. BIS7]|uniref:LysR family transcriptional regulator n=1 Tax=Cupriavidus sp. BIS7 TaxID=1217718 RepID=UPI0002F16525|nr:LysR substrate-binding domain-containing protein [Cupriavidus sp. BIS7]
MKLQQLRVMLAVAEHGSIHEASRTLHISQPALSKSIADLERELGVTLLARSARGVSLTAYGRAILKRARVVEQELRYAVEDIESIRGHAEAELNIGFTPVAANARLTEAMSAFRQRFPHVTLRAFEMRPQQIQEGLREGRLDLGLVSTNSAPCTTALQWEHMFSVGMKLAVRAGHPLRHVRHIHALLDADWLVLDPVDDVNSPLPTLMRMHRLAMPPRIVHVASNLLGLQLAAGSNLVSVWSELAFPGTGGPLQLAGDALVPLPIEDELPAFHVHLVYRSADLMTNVCAEFAREVRRCTTGVDTAAPPPVTPAWFQSPQAPVSAARAANTPTLAGSYMV